MNLTIHVLMTWPKGGAAPEPGTTGPIPPPDRMLTYVEHGNDDSAWKECNAVAGRFRTDGHPVTLVTVVVGADRANPTALASALAMQQLGHSPTTVVGTVRRACDDDVEQVDPAEAAEYLATIYDLHVDPANKIRVSVLLRLARRVLCGDPFADLALAEMAAELRHLDGEPLHDATALAR